MKKVGVYYIATDKYKDFFPGFLESVHKLFPAYEKVVKVISDGLREYDGWHEGMVRVEHAMHIAHYPWPVNTLYKMWLVLQCRDDSLDYAFYFNANCIICDNEYEEDFDPKRLNVSFHSFNGVTEYDAFSCVHISPKSVAYIGHNDYKYIQGGFWGGPADLVWRMCKDVSDMVFEDTVHRLVIPQWHDESMLNKWCVDHESLVKKSQVMCVYRELIDKHRFVWLRDKGKLVDEVKVKNIAHGGPAS